jgi:hypothetical protein
VARPKKVGLDYFPLDTVLDTKFELIEAEFGLQGFAIIVKLLQKIYREFGYYCEWDTEVALLFSKRNNVGCNVVSETISSAIKRGIFDKAIYDKYHILTSEDIQVRYISAKRANFSIIKNEYLLISVPENEVSATKTPVSVTKTDVNVETMPQSKVEERKPNNSKVNQTKINNWFEEVWSVYPKKIKKQEAFDEFCSLDLDENLLVVIVNAIKKQSRQEDWKIEGGKYIPFLVNWLKNKRWEDEINDKGYIIRKGTDSFNNFTQKIYSDEFIKERLRAKGQTCI